MKKKPQRTCMGCNSKKDKNEITVDKTGKLEGRGAYICNSMECLEKAIKSRRIEKAIEAKISDEIFEQLKSLINGGEYIG